MAPHTCHERGVRNSRGRGGTHVHTCQRPGICPLADCLLDGRRWIPADPGRPSSTAHTASTGCGTTSPSSRCMPWNPAGGPWLIAFRGHARIIGVSMGRSTTRYAVRGPDDDVLRRFFFFCRYTPCCKRSAKHRGSTPRKVCVCAARRPVPHDAHVMILGSLLVVLLLMQGRRPDQTAPKQLQRAPL